MGLKGNRPPEGTNVVPLFSRAVNPEQSQSSSLSSFFDFAYTLQDAFLSYNLSLLKITAAYTKQMMDSCLPPSTPPPRIIVADKEWLSVQAGYDPFLKNLATEGYHEIAAYNGSLRHIDSDTVTPVKIVYWMNVMQDGNYAHIFHGDSEGRAGTLMELSWIEEAGAFALACFRMDNKTPLKVEEEYVYDNSCKLLMDLVYAINQQTLQANSRLYHGISPDRPHGSPLHLVR